MNKLTMFIVLVILPLLASAECTCEPETKENSNNTTTQALKLKLAAIFSILIAGSLGVSLPILGKRIPALHPENNIFFLVKAFAAGVILSTGFIHVLPDAFENLTNPCLSEKWTEFPFTGLFAMCAAIVTMMIDVTATNFYRKSHFSQPEPLNGDQELQGEHEGHVHVPTHASHGHAHGSAFVEESDDPIKHKIVSKVLEIGIVIHSVVIGVSLGASQSPEEIRPLVAALTFHQFFEGMGLGGCIAQAKFKSRAIAIMVLFFSLTTPVGIVVGMGISSKYDENGVSALLCEGILNSISAGILVYMALVDLLAADFMNPKMQGNLKLQLAAHSCLLVGAGCMSILAKWA